jgi:hypothetical protein
MKEKLFLFAVILTLASCHGPKYHFKNGNRYAKSFMLKQSVTEYKLALDKRPNKVKYKIAMEQSGRALLEELYTNYRFADGQDSLSVYYYLEAEQWRTYLSPYINTTSYTGFYDQDYQAQLKRFVDQKYQRAEGLIRLRKFDLAQSNLIEIQRLSPGYRNTKALLEFSEVEPIYAQALERFEARDYRGTYNLLKPVIQKYPQQQTIQQLSDEAVEKGIFRLGIVSDPLVKGSAATMSASMQSTLIRLIQAKEDPFLELLDRTNFELLQQEQSVIIDGGSSERAISQEILAADAYLKVAITAMDEVEGNLESSYKQGWEKYLVKTKNDAGEEVTKAEYKKVQYKEFEKENHANYELQLTLTERATSKILWTKRFNYTDRDEIHYIEFNGSGDLFSGSWKYQNKEHPSDHRNNDSGRLNALRKNSKRIKGTSTMRREAVDKMGQEASEFISSKELVRAE